MATNETNIQTNVFHNSTTGADSCMLTTKAYFMKRLIFYYS
jgi:hypothetical protein